MIFDQEKEKTFVGFVDENKNRKPVTVTEGLSFLPLVIPSFRNTVLPLQNHTRDLNFKSYRIVFQSADHFQTFSTVAVSLSLLDFLVLKIRDKKHL